MASSVWSDNGINSSEAINKIDFCFELRRLFMMTAAYGKPYFSLP